MDLWKMNDFLNYVPDFSEDPVHLLDDIVNRAKKYLPEEQISGIYKSYEFAKKAHKGVLRLSGEPYIIHPVRATMFLMEMNPDISSIQACFLHDVIEDTDIIYNQIKDEFGEEVANLCEGLVKVSKIKYKGEDRYLETLKKTFIAMAKDLRVIFVKLADRIHNIQTLAFHPEIEKRYKIANETMKIYVSIARKLGLYDFQLYLENGSFRILYEEEFNKIFNYLKKSFGIEKKYKDRGIKILTAKLKKEGIKDFRIVGRLKSPWRIYQKMMRKYKSFDISNIMDLLAYRIITKNIVDCYIIFGIIHKYYTPLINKIKDYIAIPKFNGYKSIHTTVLGIFRFPTEIQIRTEEMDDIAKYGVAAHFKYSEKGSSSIVDENQSKWIKKVQQIVDSYTNSDEKENFKNKLNIEILEKSTFLYTPNGDVLELPSGSTVLDFAFRIHSNIGLRYKNAMVNGEIKPISYIPKTGDVIEVKVFKNRYSANKHRLEFLHTPSAKSKLNKFLNAERKKERIFKSIYGMNKKLAEVGLPVLYSEGDKISKQYSKSELEKILLSVLNKTSSYSQIIKSVYLGYWKKYISESKIKNIKQVNEIDKNCIIVDQDKMLDYSLCLECKPKVGDKIIARTGKNGIKIHTLSCKALNTLSFAKLLEAHRNSKEAEIYKLYLDLETTQEYGNVINIMILFSALNITIVKISIEHLDEKRNKVSLIAEFKNPTKIAFLFNDLKKYKDSIKIIKKRFLSE